ncbi:MAG: PAS domain S-box protein [Nitrospinales bacterium]
MGSLKSLDKGIQRSLAALRGWLLLKTPDLRDERKHTWKEEIWPQVNALEKANWVATAGNQNALAKLKRLLIDLFEWQWRIEDVADTPGNEPAQVALRHNVIPVADSIKVAITALIKLENQLQENGKRKRILSSIAEFRHLFSRGHAFLTGFVASADPIDEERFHQDLNSAVNVLQDLNDSQNILTVEQWELLRWIQTEFQAYVFFSKETLSLRKTDNWNVSQAWLGNQALPLVRQINDLLQFLSLNLEKEMATDAEEAATLSNISISLDFLLIVIMILAAVFVSRYGAEQIIKPIAALARGTKKFADNQLTTDIPVTSEDEIGLLTKYFNTMRASLVESYGRTRSIVDSAVDGIITIDESGTVESFNKSAEQIFGYSAKDVVGRNVKMLMPESYSNEHGDELVNDLKAGKAGILGVGHEVKGQREDGSVFPMDLAVSEMHAGKNHLFIGIVRDITERKQIEKELARHRDYLDELVKKRTRDLEAAQEELVRRERLATLGELSAKVSHEIRNPLMTLRMLITSFGQSVHGNPEIENMLTMAERNIVRCENIIEELLDFARSHRDRKQEVTAIDPWLNELIDEQTAPEQVTVEKNLASGAKVNLDRERFRRAVINVMNNGYQALMGKYDRGNEDSRETEDYLLVVETGVAMEKLEIRIRDTGIGIPPDQLEKIFEPMYSTKSFGVGLGLPIVKEILQQHNGGIEIESQLNKGTTILLWLPLIKSESAS